MPFAKGNKLWQKGLEVREEKSRKIDSLMMTLTNGGIDRYAEIMDKLADGDDITKAERDYLDRIDSWREYVLPKLARKELTGKNGGALTLNVINDYGNNDSA